jgi:cell division protein FtsL
VISCVAVAAALIFVAWAKMQTVQITYRIDELIDTEEELANDQRRLRTQLAELRSPRNLEALAPDLGLVPPEPGQVVVVTGDPEGLTAILEGSDEEPTDETDASAPAPDADAEEGTP